MLAAQRATAERSFAESRASGSSLFGRDGDDGDGAAQRSEPARQALRGIRWTEVR